MTVATVKSATNIIIEMTLIIKQNNIVSLILVSDHVASLLTETDGF